MDRQVAKAVSIAQKIPGFGGVTEQEVLGIAQTEQRETTGGDFVEEADERKLKEGEGEDKRKYRPGVCCKGGRGEGRPFDSDPSLLFELVKSITACPNTVLLPYLEILLTQQTLITVFKAHTLLKKF